jgi:hypothetical protein
MTDDNHDQTDSGLTRRDFLRALGTGAVAPAAVLGSRDAAAQALQHRRFVIREDRFGRIFRDLPPFAGPSQRLTQALLDIGKPGGIMDANDPLAAGPVRLITEAALSANNPDNTTHTAGTTFMGQFLDHDMTFDLQSRLGVPTDPEDSPNARTPTFDLDTVYGGGPTASPELYERGDRRRSRSDLSRVKLRIESGGQFEDLPRTANNVAIIGDPRNDENMMISGLHAAFIMFHNHAVDVVAARDRRDAPEEVYRKARRLTTWHYQWMIVHEFLPLFVGQRMVDTVMGRGRRYYTPREAFIPVEFQGAVYRFGHSMVRPSYRANLAGQGGAPFFGFIFDPTAEGQADPADLRGFTRAPRRFIDWQTFFDFGDGQMRTNKLIDTKLSTPLFNLPRATIPAPDGPTSLAQRNLLRHITWQLPSGQRIAREIGAPSLAANDLSELKDYGANLDTSTPLFYYILKEAQLVNGGRTLGPVGGRIVAEVFAGLLQLDRESYLAVNPRWRPTLPNRFGQLPGDFRMVDFLTFAGVAPVQRGG